MISISQRTRDIVFCAGIVLFVVGGVLVWQSFKHFNNLPNYVRIATPIPIMSAYVMLRIDQYRNWSMVKGAARGHAIGALLAPPMLLVGSIIWFLAAPAGRG